MDAVQRARAYGANGGFPLDGSNTTTAHLIAVRLLMMQIVVRGERGGVDNAGWRWWRLKLNYIKNN